MKTHFKKFCGQWIAYEMMMDDGCGNTYYRGIIPHTIMKSVCDRIKSIFPSCMICIAGPETKTVLKDHNITLEYNMSLYFRDGSDEAHFIMLFNDGIENGTEI
jgi:hypothetical protein